MKTKIIRYSNFIRPLVAILDLVIIAIILFFFSDKEFSNIQFLSYLIFSWLMSAYYSNYYEVYRYTQILKICSLLVSNLFLFTLFFLAYFTVFREGIVVNRQLELLSIIIICLAAFKIILFFLLKLYRKSGGNYRRVVVIGESFAAQNIEKIFNNRLDFGYRFLGYFSDSKNNSSNHLGEISSLPKFVIENSIDEIYCEVKAITLNQRKKIRIFANENQIGFRLIPENKAIYSKNFVLEHYGTIPVLKPKKLPFEKIETHIIKRVFDIIFSTLVCVFILSWLLPILFVLVKLDSKGPFFFKQKRDGVEGQQFYCYKIRSMKLNHEADKKSATKNDNRITRIGAIIRKTSMDELPQFFNVLRGDMSVVGPRPHMNIQTKKYVREIENYLIRNSVKPGITGLAQINGYRGEIVKKSDINNRVKFDIFYIENWTFFLDLKIIFKTFFGVFLGDEKAY